MILAWVFEETEADTKALKGLQFYQIGLLAFTFGLWEFGLCTLYHRVTKHESYKRYS